MDEKDFTDANSLRSRLAAAPYVAIVVLTLGVLLFAAGTSAVGVAPAAAERIKGSSAEQAQRHGEAVQAFVAQRYATAYGRFAALADEGHAPSALMALALVSHGSSAFGSAWSATPAQLTRWSALAADETRELRALIAEHDRGE